MDPKVVDILAEASESQRAYVYARLIHNSVPSAARAAGIHRTTPHKWDNLPELEEAVTILKADMIEATKAALTGISLDAVKAVADILRRGHGESAVVAAARAVWDRIGLPAMSAVDVTSGGEPLRATVYIPDNGRDDRGD